MIPLLIEMEFNNENDEGGFACALGKQRVLLPAADTSDELRDHTDCDEDGENHSCPNRRRIPVFEFVNWIPSEVHAS